MLLGGIGLNAYSQFLLANCLHSCSKHRHGSSNVPQVLHLFVPHALLYFVETLLIWCRQMYIVSHDPQGAGLVLLIWNCDKELCVVELILLGSVVSLSSYPHAAC